MVEPTPPPPSLESRKTRRVTRGSTPSGQATNGAPGEHDGFGFGSRSLAAAVGAVLLATVLIVAVVGLRNNNDTKEQSISAGATTAPARAAAPTSCKKANGIPAANGKPKDIAVPAKPVGKLEVRDLKKGSGPAVDSGAKLTVQYVGVSCSSGRQFDASWDTGKPFEFTLGGSQVIPGWDQGIKGMRVGGRRQLWIPGALAYGDQGQPPVIAPNDTLIFVIDLQKTA